MKMLELDVVATRGDDVESIHRVHAAVVNGDDSLVASARDSSLVTSWRSCAKLFQVMPLLESGSFEELHWGDDQLALACASHGGEPEHVAVAQRMLADLGFEEGDLACGPHEPLAARGQKLLRDSGAPLTRLHNNCSGKHAAMLARAHLAGWATVGYERRDHPVQRSCHEVVAKWAGLAPADVHLAVDGCGVIVFALPLENMARAYARLGRAMRDGETCANRIERAVKNRPFLFGGSDRFDSILIEESKGRVIPKVGAEGVHSVAVPEQGIGITVKAEDGAQRAQYPALLRALQLFDVLPMTLPPRLEEFMRRPIRNTRGEVVGEVRPAA
jgi:L-asparaginase II